MALVLIGGPAIEPVTLEQTKTHLRVDQTDEDTLITSLITAARIHVEVLLGRSLITQYWLFILDEWPQGPVLELPLVPLQKVTEIRTIAADDSTTLVPADDYYTDTHSLKPRLIRRDGGSWPEPGRSFNGIEIDLTTGYGDQENDVPKPICQALLLFVAHWYERREPVSLGESAIYVPETASTLLAPYKRVNL